MVARTLVAAVLVARCGSAQNLVPKVHYGFATNLSAATPFRRKAAVFASVGDGEMVLFSGKAKDWRVNRGHMAYVGDTWRLRLNGRGAEWTRLDFGLLRRDRPDARWKSAGDGVDGRLYIFGGHVQRGSASIFYDDLWVLDAEDAWRQILPETSDAPWPSRRRGHAVAAASGKLVVVGGRREKKQCLSDVWVYDPGPNAWVEAPTPGYGCRWGHTATSVPRIDGAPFLTDPVVAVFGGRHKEDNGDYDYFGGTQHSVWLYSVTRDVWEEAVAATEVGPAARDHHAAAYVDGGLFVTGGKTTDLAAEAQDDLWRFDLATRTWTDLSAGKQPRSRYLHSAATWPSAPPLTPAGGDRKGAMVVFGGEHIKSRRHGKKKYVRYNDVWGYWPEGTWVELIDDVGDESALYLSPFALEGVKRAAMAATVLTAAGVIVTAIYYRTSIPNAIY